MRIENDFQLFSAAQGVERRLGVLAENSIHIAGRRVEYPASVPVALTHANAIRSQSRQVVRVKAARGRRYVARKASRPKWRSRLLNAEEFLQKGNDFLVRQSLAVCRHSVIPQI